MQYKYPELFWALFLLLIPILVHFFKLRRFKKTPFTNVKFLQQVASESQSARALKEYLLFLTRILLLIAIVLAFTRPFLAGQSALKKKETVVYIDNSFSMQLKKDGITLMEDGVQQFIKSFPKTERFSLFTNTRTFKNILLEDVQNELLALAHDSRQLKLGEIYLKGQTLFTNDSTTDKNLVIISDFQQLMGNSKIDNSEGILTHIVQLSSDTPKNVAIDSVYLDTEETESLNLTALLSSNVSMENIPVSLFNGEVLIAKTSASFDEKRTAKVNFTIPRNEVFKGKVSVTDPGLNYDNQLYFNIDQSEKIKVKSIGPADSNFLDRIYSKDEFVLSMTTLNNLNYGALTTQNLIILNELPAVPAPLAASLNAFVKEGGHLVVIPAEEIDLDSYNLLASNYFSSSFMQRIDSEPKITDISFSHPLYRNVFVKNVTNFEYPEVRQYFGVRTTAPSALSFQNKAPFLLGADEFFLFTASLSPENSNFRNSPLIVPTFYNMGINSLKLPQLYHVLGGSATIDVPVDLPKDNILKISKGTHEIIPRQQSLANRVSLLIDENLNEDGIYTIHGNQKSIASVSFNYKRSESDLSYLNLEQLQTTSKEPSLASMFESMEKNNAVTQLWKWFVILAFLLLLVEILIQKFLR